MFPSSVKELFEDAFSDENLYDQDVAPFVPAVKFLWNVGMAKKIPPVQGIARPRNSDVEDAVAAAAVSAAAEPPSPCHGNANRMSGDSEASASEANGTGDGVEDFINTVLSRIGEITEGSGEGQDA
jgi:hypothetical protein